MARAFGTEATTGRCQIYNGGHPIQDRIITGISENHRYNVAHSI